MPGTDVMASDSSCCNFASLGGEAANDEVFAPLEAVSAEPAVVPGGDYPAYFSGARVDANGNPNQASGELQTQYNCELGFETDSERCEEVQEKMDNWVPTG